MSLKAIFRFENLDSTQDLNDRFKFLFKKGIYNGGEVSNPTIGAGSNIVTVEPFEAMSFDGMAVRLDTSINVPLLSLYTQYIVLIAKYMIEANPQLEIKAVSSEEANSDPYAVKLCKIINRSEISTELEDRDVIDPISRNHYKGISEIEISPSVLVKGDFYFERNSSNGSYDIVVKTQDGIEQSSIQRYTSASVVQGELDKHRSNQIYVPQDAVISIEDPDSPDYTEADDKFIGFWQSPTILNWETTATPSLLDISYCQTFGSYHISINKWFATEGIFKEWELLDVKWKGSDADIDENSDGYIDNVTVADLISILNSDKSYYIPSHETVWENSTVRVRRQIPSKDNRFITQNYPVLPTSNEKFALAGNLLSAGMTPGENNRYVLNKTAGIKLTTVSASIVSPESGYYYYPINSLNTLNVYIGNSDNILNSELYLKYFNITLLNSVDVNKASDIRIVAKSRESGASYETLGSTHYNSNSTDVYGNRGFLKREYIYYVKTPVSLQGSIYYYIGTDIDKTEYGIVTDSIHKSVRSINTLFVEDELKLGIYSVINSNDSNLGVKVGTNSKQGMLSLSDGENSAKYGTLFVDNTGKLKYKYNDGTNVEFTVFLIKESSNA